MYVVYLAQAKVYQMTSVCDLKQTGSTAVGGPIPQTTPDMTFWRLNSAWWGLISHTTLPTCDLVSLIFNGTRDHPLRYNSRLNSKWKIQISPVLWVCGLISPSAQPLTAKFHCLELRRFSIRCDREAPACQNGWIAKVCFAQCSTSRLALGSPGCLSSSSSSSPCPK